MALSIRRGASRVIQLTLERCEAQDFLWGDFNTILVRLSQGSVNIDKTPVIQENDPSSCLVYYSQEDTLRFSDKQKARLQVFLLYESNEHQCAVKSDVYNVVVTESLWNEAITSGVYSGNESLELVDPNYQYPIGHDCYSFLHIDITEFRGIIKEAVEAALEGDSLAYNPSNETLSAESS